MKGTRVVHVPVRVFRHARSLRTRFVAADSSQPPKTSIVLLKRTAECFLLFAKSTSVAAVDHILVVASKTETLPSLIA